MSDETGYAIDDRPLVGTLQKLDVQQVIDATTDRWSNRTLCRVDDVVVRLGVLEGEFHWHKHDDEDEFFLVLDGLMRNTPDARSFIARAASQGVHAVVQDRDAPFGDYSTAEPAQKPAPDHTITPGP